MKVLVRQFLSRNHSWSLVGQNIARSLIKKGHNVDLFSTNGTEYFPDDLKLYLIGHYDDKLQQTVGTIPNDEYDMQISYTAFKNFPMYLSNGTKNRFGIWTFEFMGKNALPDGFAKNYKYTDLILPPSQFAKEVFVASGVPEQYMKVIPHGVDLQQIEDAKPFAFKTKKNTKILAVIAQIHRRKNLSGLLEMYGRAFNSKDDVCLILKIQDKIPTQPFEVSFKDIFTKFKQKFKDHAEIEIIRDFIPNIYSLYKSCDIVFSASHCEGFGMTALEAHSLGKINIVPNYGGFTDFVNDQNGLLIDGEEFIVPANFLYWTSKPHTKAFMPNIDSGVEQLRYAVANKLALLEKYQANITNIKEKYSWDNVADQILELTNV